jgi:ribosomal subunit interface protein
MRVQFTYKHMVSSQALMDITEGKFGNLLKRFKPSPQHVRVTFSMEGRLIRMHASVITNDGHNLEADCISENAYSLVDSVLQKLDAQFRRRKERLKFYKGEGLRGAVRASTLFYSSGERFESFTESDTMRALSFWNQPPVDAGDILSLSPQLRGPLEPVCAS